MIFKKIEVWGDIAEHRKTTAQFPFCSLLFFSGSTFPQGSNLLTGIITQDSFLKFNNLLTAGQRKGRMCPSNWEICSRVRVDTNLLSLALYCTKNTCAKGIYIFSLSLPSHAHETLKTAPSRLQLKKKQTQSNPLSFTNIPPTSSNADKHRSGLTTLGSFIIRMRCHWARCSVFNKTDCNLTSIVLVSCWKQQTLGLLTFSQSFSHSFHPLTCPSTHSLFSRIFEVSITEFL